MALHRMIFAASLWTATACVAPDDANPANAYEAQNESAVCRPADFSGCCSKNAGVADIRTGKCGSGKISPTCDSRWETSLRGRCSYNNGVARVEIDGVVYCNNEKSPGTPIPKCPSITHETEAQ